MSEAFKVKTASWNPTAPYLVDGVMGSKRIRRFYASEDEAKRVAEEYSIQAERHGSEGFLDDRTRRDALIAKSILAPTKATLIEAADYYVSRHAIATDSCRFSDLYEEFQKESDAKRAAGDMSEGHWQTIRVVGKRLVEEFGDQTVSEITQKSLVKWLTGCDVSNASKDVYRRYASIFFAYAKERQYTDANPVEGMKAFNSKSGEVGILSVDEAEALLRTADPDLIGYWALALFAGLRPKSELMAVTWADLDFEDGLVQVHNTKTRNHSRSARRRYVPMSDNLRAWLNIAVFNAKNDHGPTVAPKLSAKRVYGDENRKKAIEWCDERQVSSAGLKEWAKDATRHSFASYWLAKHQDAARLATYLGHTSNDMIYGHYNRLVKPSMADRYWNILPE